MCKIRYANCWEDAEIMLPALRVTKGGSYLSIASAGDNTLSILSREPSLVLAVDSNPAQIACLEIRKAAFTCLEHEQVLRFLGIKRSPDRLSVYRTLKSQLSRESRVFWDMNHDLIQQGVIHAGTTEKYFRWFRKMILPFLIHKSRICELFATENVSERMDFYDRHIDTWRWRTFFPLFFGRLALSLLDLGRTPDFYDNVEIDIPKYVMKRAEYILTRVPTRNNHYLEYILYGTYRRAFPYYLRRNNFERIRANLDKLKISRGGLIDALEREPSQRFDGFNLSDIFERMNAEQYCNALSCIIGHSNKNCRLVYWNNLVQRSSAQCNIHAIKPIHSTATRLFKESKAFFYSSFIVEEIT